MMKIVVLDGHTLNPGDLSWSGVERLGELEVHERTSVEKLMERAEGADVLLTNKTPLTAETIGSLKELKYIGVLATGCNVVDLEAARARGIPVCNAAGYSTPAVAQMVFAYILHFMNRVADHSAGVRNGKWQASEDFCYWDYPQVELASRTIGIVGLGDIGGRVARIARAFGMTVLATTRRPERPAPEGVQWARYEDLLAASDIVSLHCPLTEETKGLINAGSLARMKEGAILINTGRGPLVVEADLAEALNRGHLGGAGIDVLNEEPPRYESPLFTAQNCLITPHIAWATRDSRQRLMKITESNLEAFIKGETLKPVN